jgi:hypothetical protein
VARLTPGDRQRLSYDHDIGVFIFNDKDVDVHASTMSQPPERVRSLEHAVTR